jgi:acyl dehydratase
MMQPGDIAARLVVDPVPASSMKTMAALLNDPVPIHWDAALVKELGLGDRPINQGPINAGYLVELASKAAGGPDGIRAISVRFHDNVFAGDRVECEATVRAADPAGGTVELELSATASGRVVMSGKATIEALRC